MKTSQKLFTAIGCLIFSCTALSSNAQQAAPKSNSLQVVFVSFEAYGDTKGNVIEWSTILEANLDKYLLQRSINNSPFETIAEIKSKGRQTSVTTYYTFTDTDPGVGKNIYRLVMMDVHRNTKISETKTVSWSGNVELNNSFHTYPNPARPGEMIHINVHEKSDYYVQFISLGGRQVYHARIASGSSNVFSMRVPATLGKGFYVVKLIKEHSAETLQQKIMIM